MYLKQTEVAAIKAKIDAGEAPWTAAYAQVIASAETALTAPLESVTFGGIHFPGSRQYATRRTNGTTAFVRYDYFAAIRLKDSVRDLGLAYSFTDDPAQKAIYADKAIEFIEHWSLSPTTGMLTTPGNSIETFITMPGYFYGADLISDYGGWAPDRKEAFEGWVRSIGTNVRNRGEGPNNFANWKTLMMASVGSFLHDDTDDGFLDYAEAEWKFWLPIQMNGSGSSRAGLLGQEVGRDDGLHYSLYALNAMIQGAEILLNEGVNVYDYVAPNGSSLKLGLDFIAP